MEALIDHVVVINQSQLLLDASVSDICDRYTFGYRPASAMDGSVLYAEPTLQGHAVVARRSEGDPETPLNLELLFNALVSEGSKLHDNH